MHPAARMLRRSSRGTLVLVLALGLLFNLGTLQILVESREFAPNQKSPRGNALRTAYWPESPVSTSELGDPLADWLGLEEYLARASLQNSQIEALRPLEDRALEAAEMALEGYTRLLEPLTPYQRRKLAEPQPGVVDHRTLGLDSAGLDHILVWLHRLDERAHEAEKPAPAQSPIPSPMRMAPTRLAVSMTRLLDDPHEPLTPAQARAILKREVELRKALDILHHTHAQARRVLTSAQLQEALSLPLRRWEPFPSPRALEIFIRSVQERRKEISGT
jgi:hypothetical protein